MINVLYIVNEAVLGGAAQSLLDMLESSTDRIRATVIIPSEGIIEERLCQLQISYHIIPFATDHRKIGTHSLEEADMVFFHAYRAALELQDIIMREKIQLVHTNSSVSNVGAIAALMAGIPHIWHIRELLEEDFGCEFLDKGLKQELFHCADAVISISDCVRDAYCQKYGIKSTRIYNGLNMAKFLNKDHTLKRQDCFLLAGVLSPHKGQLEAVCAVNVLLKKGIPVHLYIVGAGSEQYRWILKRIVKQYGLESYVHILSFRRDLGRLRAICQYSVTPSRMEALGRVTVEAMLAGCIVIGADTGGTAEIIGQNSDRGYLYRQGDYNDLARVMQYAMGQKERNRFLQTKAQEYALRTFDADLYIQKVMNIYDAVLEKETKSDTDRKRGLTEKLKDRYKGLRLINIHQSMENRHYNDKNQKMQETAQRWLCIELENKLFEGVLTKKNISSIAIYGMGYLGCCLYDRLENTSVKIEYVMDRNMSELKKVVKTVSLDEELPKVDAVIVTVSGETERLCQLIRAKCNCKIMTLAELLNLCEEQ